MIHLPFPEAWQYRDFGHANALMQGDLASTLLARLGIQVKPGNRLDRARKLVRGLEGESGIRHSLDTDFMERLQDALETIGQLFVIAALMVENPRPPVARKLEELLSGNLLRREDKNTAARDTQFELYVGALIAFGGFDVNIGEPDLRFRYLNGEVVGVAVKRINSPKQIRRRLSDALAQLEREQVRGFIAINVECLLRDLSTFAPARDTGEQFERRLNLHQYASTVAKSTKLLGILAIANLTSSAPTSPPYVDSQLVLHLQSTVTSPEDEQLTRAFFYQLRERIAESQRRINMTAGGKAVQ